eukprot:CAMPEP_0178956676 /NCGR_PEP_ID=MMETSP0789-20121207/10426_1 /TAXON_ID=3005 /ORGANISM="Rhizosolenia setigera, Strain CCMP 1694" /LENGTH=360 /DNA_ID=CAMNT_0020638711 /DNA_START=185 /DNA_END=1267 /DNA_ORIENTATION=-
MKPSSISPAPVRVSPKTLSAQSMILLKESLSRITPGGRCGGAAQPQDDEKQTKAKKEPTIDARESSIQVLPKDPSSEYPSTSSSCAPSNAPLTAQDVGESTSQEDLSISKKKNKQPSKFNTGRWGCEEKICFLMGLRKYGKGRWKQIGKVVKTRSLIQIKSHAQKVLKKMEAGEDVFAVLDEDPDNRIHSHLDYEKGAIMPPSSGDFLGSPTAPVKAPVSNSMFSWILPAGSRTDHTKQHETDAFSCHEQQLTHDITPRRKRMGWWRSEPRNKIARTDSFTSVRSSIKDGEEGDAVEALSALFLSTPSTMSVCSNPVSQSISFDTHSDAASVATSVQTSHETCSRTEDAEILLSLMGAHK